MSILNIFVTEGENGRLSIFFLITLDYCDPQLQLGKNINNKKKIVGSFYNMERTVEIR